MELWRTTRPGEAEQEHFCADDCSDPERAVGLVRVPFEEAVERVRVVICGRDEPCQPPHHQDRAELIVRAIVGEDY